MHMKTLQRITPGGFSGFRGEKFTTTARAVERNAQSDDVDAHQCVVAVVWGGVPDEQAELRYQRLLVRCKLVVQISKPGRMAASAPEVGNDGQGCTGCHGDSRDAARGIAAGHLTWAMYARNAKMTPKENRKLTSSRPTEMNVSVIDEMEGCIFMYTIILMQQSVSIQNAALRKCCSICA